MSDDQNPFGSYDLLLHQYSDRVEPLLAQLRQRVDDELARIRQQAADLLADRTQALLELQTALGVDARFLLKTSQFQEFFEKFINVKPKFDPDRTPEVDAIVSNWLLSRSDTPVRVFDYQEKFDPDDYDDERNYASYSFDVKVGWGEETIAVTSIQTLKIYGVEDDRENSCTDRAESICWGLEDFSDGDETEIPIEELSYLVTYCCFLLAQKPPTVEFTYNSAEKERNQWELLI